MQYKKTFIMCMVFLMILVAGASLVFAQEHQSGLDITISPAIIELSNVPGTVIQSRFRIRNNLDTQQNLRLSVAKLSTNGTNDSIQPLQGEQGDDFLKWISFDQASISARPKEWSDVRFTIAVPKTAAFGYYYAIRITQIPPNAPTNTVSTKIVGEVLLPVLLDVQHDGAVAQAEITKFAPVSFINEYLPVEFTTRIKNTGNIHIKPRGNIFIHTGGEKDASVLDVNQSSGIILPGSSRNFQSEWNDGFFVQEPILQDGVAKVDKNNHPLTALTIYWNKLTSFRIGKYTASIIVVYDNGKRDVALEANTSFWVFPYKIIGGVMLGIILLAVIIRLLLHWYIKRQVDKYKAKT